MTRADAALLCLLCLPTLLGLLVLLGQFGSGTCSPITTALNGLPRVRESDLGGTDVLLRFAFPLDARRPTSLPPVRLTSGGFRREAALLLHSHT